LLDAEQPLLSPVERSHRPMPELALMRCRALLFPLTQMPWPSFAGFDFQLCEAKHENC
jgi:hypothetical protein